jgi:hypothetical protein
VLALLPFVRGCADELASLNAARLLWLAFAIAQLAGIAALAALSQPDASRRRGDAATAVALFALVPAYLEYGIQVRTDPLALAAATWGAVALVASRRRLALAALAGALVGCGYLASQKAYYLAAAGVTLAIADALRRRERELGFAALRGMLALASYFAVVALQRAWSSAHFELPERSAARSLVPSADFVLRGFSHFEFFRNTIGWTQVLGWLPYLVPHALLLAGLCIAGLRALRVSDASNRNDVATAESTRGALATSAALLALGAAVLLFHGSRFAYFWLSFGCFPALALAHARGFALDALAETARARRLVVISIASILALQAGWHSLGMLRDTQAVQRASLDFVHRNFAPADTGFLPESALYCQAPPERLPAYFSQDLFRHFAGPARAKNSSALEARFRRVQVKYLVHSFRLQQFPEELRSFFAENYQPYFGSVSVAGRRFEGSRGDRADFELIVSGDYRWIPFGRAAALTLDGRRVEAGDVLSLGAGAHSAAFPEDATQGLLVISLADPPARAPLAFYKPY